MDGLPGPLKQLRLKLAENPEQQEATVAPLSTFPMVDEITEKHKWVVAALESGFRAAEVAKMFGLSEGYVQIIAQWEHPDLDAARQAARDRMSGAVVDLTQRIKYHAEEALGRTVQIMRGPDVSNARMAAKDIMDRAGYSPVKKIASVEAEVPSHEFVAAVERMSAVEEVRTRKVEWQFQDPRKQGGQGQQTGQQIPTSAKIALPATEKAP